jgi:REP element-mobilizing transposase RayT
LNDTVGAIHESPLQMTKKQRRIMLLSKIIGRFKMTSAKKINILQNNPGSPVWQRNYYEHIIRDSKDLDRICEYIIENPIKWNLDENNPNRPAELGILPRISNEI